VIASFRQQDDEMGLGYSLWVASVRSADLAAAKEMAAEADGLLQRVGAPMGVAHNAEGRGIIAYERGELGDAARFLTDAIGLFASYSNIGCTAHALEAAAVVISAAGREDAGRAGELLAAADDLRAQSGQGHRPWEIRARLGKLRGPLIADGADGAAARGPTQDGRSYSLSEAAALAVGALRSITRSTADDRA
jgi:hypothetical protein